MAKKIEIYKKGTVAPDFKLPGSDGKEYQLRNIMGDKGVVLFFYPKDNTPGCTTESCEFKEIYDEIRALGFEVYGISKDSLKSHDKFINKHDLPFILLSDEEIKTHKEYHVWKEKNMYGKLVMGVVRSTFIIDNQGKFIKEFRNIRAKGHALKIYNFIKDEIL